MMAAGVMVSILAISPLRSSILITSSCSRGLGGKLGFVTFSGRLSAIAGAGHSLGDLHAELLLILVKDVGGMTGGSRRGRGLIFGDLQSHERGHR